LVLPLGSCEQHGPHLPLATDTIVASALAAALAMARPTRVWIAPALAITASGEHAAFAGTLSMGTEALAEVIVQITRSASWVTGVVLVNGHGGNADAVAAATRRLLDEGHRVLAWWPPAVDDPRADAHAGWLETSLLLYLASGAVRVDEARPGTTAPLASYAQHLRRSGVAAVSATGVLGDPTGADAAAGATVFAAWCADLVARFDVWAA
jgi:creatinine amidohydrolase